jgi:general secretion pathway protein H
MTRGPSSGYTLLELLVVLAILGSIAALATPFTVATIESATLKADARRVASELLALQRRARETQTMISVAGDGAGVKASDGSAIAFDDGVRVSPPSGSGEIRYFDDGTSSGGALTVAGPGQSLTIQVDWLTGAIHMEASDASR